MTVDDLILFHCDDRNRRSETTLLIPVIAGRVTGLPCGRSDNRLSGGSHSAIVTAPGSRLFWASKGCSLRDWAKTHQNSRTRPSERRVRLPEAIQATRRDSSVREPERINNPPTGIGRTAAPGQTEQDGLLSSKSVATPSETFGSIYGLDEGRGLKAHSKDGLINPLFFPTMPDSRRRN